MSSSFLDAALNKMVLVPTLKHTKEADQWMCRVRILQGVVVTEARDASARTIGDSKLAFMAFDALEAGSDIQDMVVAILSEKNPGWKRSNQAPVTCDEVVKAVAQACEKIEGLILPAMEIVTPKKR